MPLFLFLLFVKCLVLRSRNKAKMRFLNHLRCHISRHRHCKYTNFFQNQKHFLRLDIFPKSKKSEKAKYFIVSQHLTNEYAVLTFIFQLFFVPLKIEVLTSLS